ncbi:type II toxin-antitoxin system VapC family toxin [Pleurocapsales cyanobacterium LEGE 10410]|nr:type II toxin-antitoxin system VapC family toxin [Pleurocapsales cyanobacterium LEGE 10410]
MTKQLLVDTDILIDVANNISTAIDRLQLEARTLSLAISVITQMELIVGCRNKTELQHLKKFLQDYELFAINESVSIQAIELVETYRLSHGLLIPDALIAATAITWNIPLLSKNQKDYRFIPELNLLTYP